MSSKMTRIFWFLSTYLKTSFIDILGTGDHPPEHKSTYPLRCCETFRQHFEKNIQDANWCHTRRLCKSLFSNRHDQSNPLKRIKTQSSLTCYSLKCGHSPSWRIRLSNIVMIIFRQLFDFLLYKLDIIHLTVSKHKNWK